ncbi:interferon gamma 1 isoform X1 [Syngnathus scovelli]|uniref:interferon gamma 1 isoform X1 n=1 Tax=Syngnathus scovelli TaxID=161590 RepID=UPI00210F433C|nr:interferon gamma isoform X1 [Syngnathus scovelli]
MVTAARGMLGMCAYLCVCGVTTSHVPARMNRTIQNLLQLYKIPPKERFNGLPVFSRELLSTKMKAKEMLMSAVLQAYEELLGHMLKQPPPGPPASTSGDDPRVGLNYLLKCVRDLRKYRFQEQDKVLSGLSELRHLQMDDAPPHGCNVTLPPQMDNLMVQSKALWELPWLYEEASLLAESGRAGMPNRLRRRRQTLPQARRRRRKP